MSADHAISICDETRDVDASRAVGVACGVVTWGYAARSALAAMKPDIIFESMADVTDQLLAAKT
jgi:phosphoglycolate phosphatase